MTVAKPVVRTTTFKSRQPLIRRFSAMMPQVSKDATQVLTDAAGELELCPPHPAARRRHSRESAMTAKQRKPLFERLKQSVSEGVGHVRGDLIRIPSNSHICPDFQSL